MTAACCTAGAAFFFVRACLFGGLSLFGCIVVECRVRCVCIFFVHESRSLLPYDKCGVSCGCFCCEPYLIWSREQRGCISEYNIISSVPALTICRNVFHVVGCAATGLGRVVCSPPKCCGRREEICQDLRRQKYALERENSDV